MDCHRRLPSAAASLKKSSRQRQHSSCVCRDSSGPEQDTAAAAEGGVPTVALNAGLLALWAALLGYVFVLAPNQTPTIDAFVVQKLVG